MVATASIKLDELLISWLGSDAIYESVMRIIEQQKESNNKRAAASDMSSSSATDGNVDDLPEDAALVAVDDGGDGHDNRSGRPPLSPNHSPSSPTRMPRTVVIPPFFHAASTSTATADDPQTPPPAPPKRRMKSSFVDDQTWDGIYMSNREGGGTILASSGGGQVDQFDHYSIATEGSGLGANGGAGSFSATNGGSGNGGVAKPCIALRARALFQELGVAAMEVQPSSSSSSSSPRHADASAVLSQYLDSATDVYHRTEEDCRYVPVERFERVTKELCNLPTFFHKPLYARILALWEGRLRRPRRSRRGGDEDKDEGGVDDDYATSGPLPPSPVVTYGVFRHFWEVEMAPYDMDERFFRLVKRPDREYITRDDFFPYIKELLNDHPGLEFLSNHAEFQDKYAVTVITRIFYSVNLCHSGRITSRQVRKSNLLSVFQQVDEEEDINKVTRYFSYEHFYVLYCRFWELDHDRDYKITREDLLKYGEHSLSHMIVDRIFDAAPRPFEGNDAVAAGTAPDEGSNNGGNAAVAVAARKMTREYLTYEDFIFFMLSEEDKANEYSVRYWFTCVDVDGDDRLNNMEMRSFYAVQLHRMQCMGHEVVPFEDMLCQMMDMIKPANMEYLIVEDFLQAHCSQVSGALFDALFNVNKYVMFEQRDPFLERQKREDEFGTDWDRFACIDYNRLAMEEEQREEEAME